MSTEDILVVPSSRLITETRQRDNTINSFNNNYQFPAAKKQQLGLSRFTFQFQFTFKKDYCLHFFYYTLCFFPQIGDHYPPNATDCTQTGWSSLPCHYGLYHLKIQIMALNYIFGLKKLDFFKFSKFISENKRLLKCFAEQTN